MEWINREHPSYLARVGMWKKYADLYAGGERLLENAALYLVRRGKEPQEVYSERLSRVFYENYVGSIIDWYAATLMRREPLLSFEGSNTAGKEFFNSFAADCDLKGTNVSEFFRQQLVNTLVYGRSFIAVDFPRFPGTLAHRGAEDALGVSRAFLASYSPDEVINWSRDAKGNLNWIVLRTSGLRQSSVTDPGWTRETRWIYYGRQEFKVFLKTEFGGETSPIELVDEGLHGLASLGRVPVFEMAVSDGLWLMNKAALLQLEHFNKSNALSWALTMGLFAMPVVYSDREWTQIVGESYYIQLGPQDRFGWTEPEGHVYQIAADNLVRLKDEIYRVCYAMAQAGGSNGANLTQSGLSKLRDFSVTHEVLRAYGDAVKETLTQVLRAVSDARQDGLAIEVSGLDDFDIGDFGAELDDAKKLLELGIQSPTLRKQLFKKIALKYFCDSSQALKNQIASEIDG